MHRRLTALGYLLAAVGVIVSGCSSAGDEVGNAEAPYRVRLPPGWTAGGTGEKELAAKAGQAGVESATGEQLAVPAGVAVTSAWSAPRSEGAANAAVIREPFPEGITRSQFVKISVANFERAFEDVMGGHLHGPHRREVGGEPAAAFSYRTKFGTRNLAVTIFHEDDAYTLTLTSPRSAASADGERALRRILASWRWTD